MGRVFDELFGDQVFYYKGKEIPVKSLGLGSDSLMRFCAYIGDFYKWSLDGITYGQIRAIRAISDKKARAIAKALVKQGVEINDIPEISEPTRMIDYRGLHCKCSNCGAVLTDTFDADDRIFNFCPMCGKKLTW